MYDCDSEFCKRPVNQYGIVCDECPLECTHCGGDGGADYRDSDDYDMFWDEPGWIKCKACSGTGRRATQTIF